MNFVCFGGLSSMNTLCDGHDEDHVCHCQALAFNPEHI